RHPYRRPPRQFPPPEARLIEFSAPNPHNPSPSPSRQAQLVFLRVPPSSLCVLCVKKQSRPHADTRVKRLDFPGVETRRTAPHAAIVDLLVASSTQSDSMKIHEYQAKQILGRYNVPVPRGEVAFSAQEAKAIAERL